MDTERHDGLAPLGTCDDMHRERGGARESGITQIHRRGAGTIPAPAAASAPGYATGFGHRLASRCAHRSEGRSHIHRRQT